MISFPICRYKKAYSQNVHRFIPEIPTDSYLRFYRVPQNSTVKGINEYNSAIFWNKKYNFCLVVGEVSDPYVKRNLSCERERNDESKTFVFVVYHPSPV